MRYTEIRPLASELTLSFPKKSHEEVDKLIRNLLFKDRQSKAPRFAHIQENIGSLTRYIYGLKEFLDEHGKIKPEHRPKE